MKQEILGHSTPVTITVVCAGVPEGSTFDIHCHIIPGIAREKLNKAALFHKKYSVGVE